jgi:hypothetical protein
MNNALSVIYAVGTLKADLTPGAKNFIIDQRLWFLSSSFELAQKSVLENEGDIFESYYNLALIEEVSVQGVTSLPFIVSPQWWYKASFDVVTPLDPISIVSIPKPQCVENVYSFWVG